MDILTGCDNAADIIRYLSQTVACDGVCSGLIKLAYLTLRSD